MPRIKFSHNYGKLLDWDDEPVTKARLLFVNMIDLEELHRCFLDYDTDNGKYKLPKKGAYLMLLFEKVMRHTPKQRHLFTTLRRYTLEKLRYYQGLVGQEVDVEYTTE